MQIILSSHCESLKGFLNKEYGYFVVCRKNRFFSQRSRHKLIPLDGHWRFILECAKLAQTKLHIEDIQIHWMELSDALYTAKHFVANQQVRHNGVEAIKLIYNAQDIINLQITFGL